MFASLNKNKKSLSEHVDKFLSLRIPNIFQMFIFHSYFPIFLKTMNMTKDKEPGKFMSCASLLDL